MTSQKVQQVINVLRENPALLKELNMVLCKMFARAKVKLSVKEKREFIAFLSKMVETPSPYVHVKM